MQFKEWYLLSEVKQIGYDEIQQKNMFGPVFHGTTEQNFENILKSGFSVPIGGARTDDVRHGYQISNYAGGIPAPVHHLGYGVYLTTVKNIAKDYQGTGKKLAQFYLDVPRLETINFGSPNTMMKWWRSNGYDMPSLKELQDKSQDEIEKIRIQSTIKLTENLRQKYDAVWFKGKGIRRLLDGDQICVFDPNRIYMFNPSLNPEDEFVPGDRVKIKELPVAVTITARRNKGRFANPFDILFNYDSKYLFNVKIMPKDLDKIKEYYQDRIYRIYITDSRFQELMQMRMSNSGKSLEESARDLVDRHLGSNITINFPEALLDKKLSKGERVK